MDTDGILDKLSEIERLLEDRKRHGVIKDKLDSLKRDVEEGADMLMVSFLGQLTRW